MTHTALMQRLTWKLLKKLTMVPPLVQTAAVTAAVKQALVMMMVMMKKMGVLQILINHLWQVGKAGVPHTLCVCALMALCLNCK